MKRYFEKWLQAVKYEYFRGLKMYYFWQFKRAGKKKDYGQQQVCGDKVMGYSKRCIEMKY